ncbi:MAG: UDP-2,4-diacetamido-2,4,6-trideoxy-beta-L-altropyranose hydrolase [Firmicutes bacterium]|nr:UDP-2,4-diacetamido-2,4,6-trideoxy-beta-L-altropyranose hydrolase [Bacillota bacterium]
MEKIAFRVDGGSKIGMGHLMRCLALAQALPGDMEGFFITKSDGKVFELIKENDYKVIKISGVSQVQDELGLVKDAIINNDIDILIIDSYELAYDYLISVKKAVDNLVSIHDFAPFPFPADIVINGNIYADELNYKSVNGDTRFLLGTKYLLMRDEFRELPKRILERTVKDILITVGGGDPLNLTPKIIKSINLIEGNIALLDKDNLHLDIVIGPAFTNLEEIVSMLRELNIDISLHFNVNKISDLMLNCDLAISAGGTTLYELAATGTPAVSILQDDNQVQGAGMLAAKGTIINLGMGDKLNIETIVEKITELIVDFELRKRMSRVGQKLVDGRGADRCVEEIIEVRSRK